MTFVDRSPQTVRGISRNGERDRFRREVVEGLSAKHKVLSPKWFYDREGSRLFDAICELPEYYVTRTEVAMLERRKFEIVSRWGDRVRIVEPGAGSGTKTRFLLEALGPSRCESYVPVDISREHLEATSARMRTEMPWLRIDPLTTDFTGSALPTGATSARTVVYFPGSTIGNFEPEEAATLLHRFRNAAGPRGVVVLGIDLKKDPKLLHAAYNDRFGVTEAFNKNILLRINRELGGDIDPSSFSHYAYYAPREERVEMHLLSRKAQVVSIEGATFRFAMGESIRTECSQKYDLESADRLARAAGLHRTATWIDDDALFAMIELRAES